MSFKILICFCLGLTVGVLSSDENERVVGGSDADIKDFPYQVSLRIQSDKNDGSKHFCGGSIISERHILTAAHCVKGIVESPFSNIRVYTGSSKSTDGQAHKIKVAEVHPEYDGSKQSANHNDIAVLTLEEPIEFNESQKKIDLSTEDVRNGDEAVVSGWGILKYPSTVIPEQLQMTRMKIVDKDHCSEALGGPLHDEQVCASKGKGIGVCSGDSGGPLVVNKKIVGIVSFGIPCARGYPDVYTNVYSYLSFIKEIMDQ